MVESRLTTMRMVWYIVMTKGKRRLIRVSTKFWQHVEGTFQDCTLSYPVPQNYSPARQELLTLAINITRWSHQMSSRKFEGCQQVIKLIIKGSHPLLSGLSWPYFGHHFCNHFGHHMSWAVVTLVITQDSPRHQVGLLVIFVITSLSFSSLGVNHGDNKYHRGHQCGHMNHRWRHAGQSQGSHES
jgi:hypothetical protein